MEDYEDLMIGGEFPGGYNWDEEEAKYIAEHSQYTGGTETKTDNPNKYIIITGVILVLVIVVGVIWYKSK